MRYESKSRPRKCPSCGSTHVARILYGLPAFSAKLKASLDAETVVLGGCCVTDDDPEWQCSACDTRIYQISSAGHNTDQSGDHA